MGRVVRLVALAAVLSAFALVGTATVRAGAPACNVSAQASAVVGEMVTVTGTGFAPNAPISVDIIPPSGPSGAVGGLTDGAGTFVVQYVLNQAGNWVFNFSQAAGCSDSVTIAVTFTCDTDVTALPSTSVPLGQLVSVTGTGFAPNTPIVVDIIPPSGPGGSLGGPTDAAGTFATQQVLNVAGNWVFDFSQPAAGCNDSVTVVAGATVTPTPQGSLQNAAMESQSPAQPLATLGFGLLLLAGLGALAFADVRSRFR